MLHAEITGEESKPMPRRTVFLIFVFLCLFAAMPPVQAQLPPAKKDPLNPAQSAQGKAGCSTTEASSCAEAAAKILPIVMGSSPMAENLRRLTDEVGGRVTGTPQMAKAVEWGVAGFRAGGGGGSPEKKLFPGALGGGRHRPGVVRGRPIPQACGRPGVGPADIRLRAKLQGFRGPWSRGKTRCASLEPSRHIPARFVRGSACRTELAGR